MGESNSSSDEDFLINASDDIFREGMRLRLIENPGVRGRATGNKRKMGSFLMVELEIGPNDRKFFRSSQLEEDCDSRDPVRHFDARSFGRPEDLRRLLSLSRMSGSLTNVLYSMESSNTEFLPHQYKPVLKFIESPVGRLLVADEVGLGKTIEAVYIWQELQARVDARRLLIICPSMLREKWKSDLLTRFGIEDAIIMDAKSLLEALETVSRGHSGKPFVAITSLEGIRVRDDDADPLSQNTRERLAGMIKKFGDNEGDFLIDLVVVDEAHYLRNSSTASHQTAAMFRDIAKNFVLLSATPLQTHEENLFNLLKLLAPEHFTDQFVFLELFSANVTLVKAISAVLYGKDLQMARNCLAEVISNPHFADEPVLQHAIKVFNGSKPPSLEDRVSIGRSLESLSLFSTYFTRSRKRDVFPDRVVRNAVPVCVDLDEYEMSVYDSVSGQIRDKSKFKKIIDVFGLISCQRQLASSIYAAIRKWKKAGDAEADDLWDDLGVLASEKEEVDRGTVGLDLDFDLRRLRENDSKYKGFIVAVRKILSENPGEKLIVFSFYRATIAYLIERLIEDGIPALSLVGGMGDERWNTIERFRDNPGLKVLVSSEVGSEGIDLQFCRYLFNYDLPWNPMKLEQRIGRLDRIGQKAEKILIYNLFCPGTIEDRVVMRLYERIEIFKNSIGDLEDIMGEYIQAISSIMIDPSLSPREREERLAQSEQALMEERIRNSELEEQAIELTGHGEHVLQSIDKAHGINRWVGPGDTISLVRDFFAIRYPQTKFTEGKIASSLEIELSGEAKLSFQRFLDTVKPAKFTSLVSAEKPILCIFDPHVEAPKNVLRFERISATHPLIRWIVSEYASDQLGLHPASSLAFDGVDHEVPAGRYCYLVQRWTVRGVKVRDEQRFFLVSLDNAGIHEKDIAETVIIAAASNSNPWHGWQAEIRNGELDEAKRRLFDYSGSRFEDFISDFQRDNEALCRRQERYICLSVERRKEGIEELIKRLMAQGKTRIVKMHEGRIRNLEKEKDRRLGQIRLQRSIGPEFSDISMGILKIS
jgi:superfamily II DNA or RNA helicase